MSAQAAHEHGPKYFVNIEGNEAPWDEATITSADIRRLAGWDAGQQVIEIDLETNVEHSLVEGEAVNLKPGHGFSKKIKFQRG